VKAISVKQPWAWAIMHGGKIIENRSQMWNYRGPLAIASSKAWANEGFADQRVREAFAARHPELSGFGGQDELLELFPQGVIIGVVELVDVHAADRAACCAPWGDQRRGAFASPRALTHLVLQDPQPLPAPVPVTGALGPWNVREPALSTVVAQLHSVADRIGR
jgi:hypothetical protein